MKTVLLYDDIANQNTAPDNADILDQLKIVGEALESMGHEYIETAFSLDIKSVIASLKEFSPQLVFNLVESVEGNGNLIFLAPALLDNLKIPYTGSPSDSIYMTSNKLLARELMIKNNIPTPEGYSAQAAAREERKLKGDFIIKSVWEHASMGIDDSSVVKPVSTKELLLDMEKRNESLGGRCFAERYIEGREFNISLLAGKKGPEVLPPAEIIFDSFDERKRNLVGYSAKWDQNSFEYNHTVRSFDFPEKDDNLLMILKQIAEKCWYTFVIGGYCRVDFRVDENNNPWVLEVNANPCLSPDAGFIAACGRAGIKPLNVIKRIIEDTGILNVSNQTHI